MADTIIERNTSGDNTAGWAVAVVVLIAIVVVGGLYFYYHRGGSPAVPNTGTPNSTNVNVTLPASGSTGGTGSTGATGATTN